MKLLCVKWEHNSAVGLWLSLFIPLWEVFCWRRRFFPSYLWKASCSRGTSRDGERWCYFRIGIQRSPLIIFVLNGEFCFSFLTRWIFFHSLTVFSGFTQMLALKHVVVSFLTMTFLQNVSYEHITCLSPDLHVMRWSWQTARHRSQSQCLSSRRRDIFFRCGDNKLIFLSQATFPAELNILIL